MIFDWLKQRKQERDLAEFKDIFEPVLGPAMLLRAYAELASEYWVEINAGRKEHPLTSRRSSNVVDLWNDGLIEGMGYLVKYSAPNPAVFVEIKDQAATTSTILARYRSGEYRKQELPNPAAGVWPVYDWLRKSAMKAGETTFGGMDASAVYANLISSLTAEQPKWAAGAPPTGALPRTTLQVVADDVEAKTKLLALTIQLGPNYLETIKSMSARIPEGDPSKREFEQMFSTIMAAKNPDDYHNRRFGRG